MDGGNEEPGMFPAPYPDVVVQNATECEPSLFEKFQGKLASASTISEEDFGSYFAGILQESESRGQAVYIAHNGELVRLGGENGQLGLADVKNLLGAFHKSNANDRRYLLSAMVESFTKFLEGMSKHGSAQLAAAVSGVTNASILTGGIPDLMPQGGNSHGTDEASGTSSMDNHLYRTDPGCPLQKKAMESMHRALNVPPSSSMFSSTTEFPAQPRPPPSRRPRGRPRKDGQAPRQKKQVDVRPALAYASTIQPPANACSREMLVRSMEQENQKMQQQLVQDLQQSSRGHDVTAPGDHIQPELRSMFQQVMQDSENGGSHSPLYTSPPASVAQSVARQDPMVFPANIDPQILPGASMSGAGLADAPGPHEQLFMSDPSMDAGQVFPSAVSSSTYPQAGGASMAPFYSAYGSSLARLQAPPSSLGSGYPNAGSSSMYDFKDEQAFPQALAQTNMSISPSQAYGSPPTQPSAPLGLMGYPLSQEPFGPGPMNAPSAKLPRRKARANGEPPSAARSNMHSLRAADPAIQGPAVPLPPCTKTLTMAQVVHTEFICEWPKPAGSGRVVHGKYYVMICPIDRCRSRTFDSVKGANVHMIQYDAAHSNGVGRQRDHARTVEICGVRIRDATPQAVGEHNRQILPATER
ncbi:hypothetical protein BJ875DRAFT_481043 [Amylocarpus encephaloides]|uniref:Uncharacterized protein n=1 Tax=Amylocarpus encephaloides TaxID=45428 RepID=A0A9P7YQC0_9HELO|nr:hypothetical protein BJ875DRAFT_481043 [Amylocarpus encephaloides]